jgi:hypothetical protein
MPAFVLIVLFSDEDEDNKNVTDSLLTDVEVDYNQSFGVGIILYTT